MPGDTRYNATYGDVLPTWVAKSDSWYMNDPLQMQNLVYEWVDFAKFFQIRAKIGSHLSKFWKNRLIFLKIWPKIEQTGTWMDYFFLQNWYLYWSASRFNTCLFSRSDCSRCRWHTHLTNHGYFDYRKNLNTPNLSPLARLKWHRFWDLLCISVSETKILDPNNPQVVLAKVMQRFSITFL